MVFFQAALLGGYAYAHLMVRRLPLGRGALVHLGVLAAAAATLPIAIAQGFGAPPTTGIAPWLIALFAASIGLPFAALAASAPLLQGWFAASGHVQARNPYVLYAASNLGSFAALIAYPFVIEPFLTLKEQAQLWSAGFALLAVLVAFASLLVARQPGIQAGNATAAAAPAIAPSTRLTWAALAAIPVGLVIAVTSYITTDIASAPFLWVLPLALYLLTFVAVFRDAPWLRQETVARLVPIPMAVLAISLLGGERQFWLLVVVVNLVAFVLLALLCHGELYRRRPAPALLTEFYLWMSLGGVVGGVFAALVAPQLFTLVYEYPILIVAAALVLPGMLAGGRKRIVAELGPVLAVAMLAVAARFGLDLRLPGTAAYAFQIVLVGLAAIDAAAASTPAAIPGAGGARLRVDRALAARLQSGCSAPQLLWRAPDRRDRRRPLPAALSRDHGAWRRAHRRYRCGRRRGAGAAHLLLSRRPDLAEHRGRACRARRPAARRRRRARERHAQLLQGQGRAMDILRDRPGGRADRARSASLYLHIGLRARSPRRPRRRAPHARRLPAAL